MVDHDDTLPRKEPTQKRSRALVDALIEATARILESDGPDALTTNRVADVAGTSIGSLYQYFPNKESLLAAVIERELSRDMDLVRAQLQENAHLPLQDLVRLLSARLIHQTRTRQKLHHQILPVIDDVHRTELVQREREELSALIASLLNDHLHELPPRHTQKPDAPERLQCALFVALNAIELSLNAVKVNAPQYLDRPELPALLTRIFEALILHD